MTAINVKNSTGDVTLVADTVDTVTLTRVAGEDSLAVAVYPHTANNLGLEIPVYEGFRVVNNTGSADTIYYTVAYNTNAIVTPVIGAAEVYRLDPGMTDQWNCAKKLPAKIVVKLISADISDYNVEAW